MKSNTVLSLSFQSCADNCNRLLSCLQFDNRPVVKREQYFRVS
uniref:Apple domain-containing protein n=1 Tax=Ascaris lumbricoides TaxID=6252 RepID=A0A0M3IT31_ASCLU